MSGTIHHLDITVSDLERSIGFYQGVMPLMGFRQTQDAPAGHNWAGIGCEIGLLAARAKNAHVHDRFAPGLHHVAFTAPSRAAVDEVYARLQDLQVKILDAPADYPQYVPGYYAVFFADPDGIKLEYVHTPRWPT